MTFIIVEDDEKTQKEIKDIILKVAFEKTDYDIKYFSNATKELCDYIETVSEPRVYILDISLGSKTSGIQIAKMIREHDWESYIIFVTNKDKQFEQVYRNIYEVFDFIEKFHNMEERLANDIKEIINRKFDNKLYYYSCRNVDLQLYMREITYIERDTCERKLIIHTKNNVFTVNKSLNKIISELDHRFKQCHRACIVNTERVAKYEWSKNKFILDTSEEVSLLSKKYKKELMRSA